MALSEETRHDFFFVIVALLLILYITGNVTPVRTALVPTVIP